LKAPEVSVAKLQVGQPVSVALDAYGKEGVFPAKIISINPAETIVEGVPVYETRVML
jgi:multidrug resistance efflux pump